MRPRVERSLCTSGFYIQSRDPFPHSLPQTLRLELNSSHNEHLVLPIPSRTKLSLLKDISGYIGLPRSKGHNRTVRIALLFSPTCTRIHSNYTISKSPSTPEALYVLKGQIGLFSGLRVSVSKPCCSTDISLLP